jgi:hypothetical protein
MRCGFRLISWELRGFQWATWSQDFASQRQRLPSGYATDFASDGMQGGDWGVPKVGFDSINRHLWLLAGAAHAEVQQKLFAAIFPSGS